MRGEGAGGGQEKKRRQKKRETGRRDRIRETVAYPIEKRVDPAVPPGGSDRCGSLCDLNAVQDNCPGDELRLGGFLSRSRNLSSPCDSSHHHCPVSHVSEACWSP